MGKPQDRPGGPRRHQAGKVYKSLIMAPGQSVSIDQLQSPTPGLIAQLKGIQTNQRYTGATIFVDHFSWLSYVHFHRSLSSDDTVKAKRAFERHCDGHGVKVLHYHADNGRFADLLLLRDIADQKQKDHLLWCKCPFSKRCGREAHLGPTGATLCAHPSACMRLHDGPRLFLIICGCMLCGQPMIYWSTHPGAQQGSGCWSGYF